jgi:hypothetical protein
MGKVSVYRIFSEKKRENAAFWKDGHEKKILHGS